jgi:hypothetical protein
MPDLVYVFGGQSLWQNNELKFSLRSAEKYLKFDRVFIFGGLPTYINDRVIHTFIPDDKGHKYLNVAYKIKKLLNDGRISEDFIFMNDDFFLKQEYNPIPYYYNKSIRDWINDYPFHKGKYYKEIEKLYAVFPEGKFFEVHFPIVYNKTKARVVIEKYKMKITLMLRSFYCNEYINEIKSEPSLDHKIYLPSRMKAVIENAPFFSASNAIGLDPAFRSRMLALFPNKSKYEKYKVGN